MNRIYISLAASIVLSSCAYLDSKFCDEVTPITLAEDYYIILYHRPIDRAGDGTLYCKLIGKDLNAATKILLTKQ